MKIFAMIQCLAAATLVCGHASALANQGTAQYWLGGEDPVVQKDKKKADPADYMDLFRSDAPWSASAGKVKGFKISTQLVLRGTDDQLKTVIEGLKARHIGLSIELGLLTYSDAPPSCGRGAEGYSRMPPDGQLYGAERVAKRLTELGGRLDFVELDEPVTWGYSRTGQTRQGYPYCHQSIDALVDQMAPQVAILKRYFPSIQFGLVDSVNGRWPDIPQGILALTDAMNSRLQTPITFVHTDVAWDSNWMPGLRILAEGLRRRGIRFGVICDGDVKAASDKEWANQALQRCRSVNSDPLTRLDDFLVQSWSERPTRMLPDSMPGTSTWILREVESIQ